MTRQKIQLALVFAVTAIVMSACEVAKEKVWLHGYILFPRDVTVLLAALLATVAAYFLQRHFLKAKAALQLSETKYKSVVDNVGIGITIMNPQMELVDFNAQMRKRFPNIDVAQRPLCYKALNDPPRQEICSYCPVRKTLQDGQVHEAVTETPRADGIHNFRVISSPLRDAAGQITGVLKITEDVTEQKQAEEALRNSELRYRLLFDSSRDALMTLAPPSWKFTSGNPAALEMFLAKSEAEFTALPPWDISPERQPDGSLSANKAREMIAVALREGSHFFEWTHRRLNGVEFPATVLLTRIEMRGQTFVQATVRDITEQRRAEERLIRSYQQLKETQAHLVQAGKMAELGQLAAGFAHEINNPMSIISSSAEILPAVLKPGAGLSTEQHNLVLKHLAKIGENVYRCKAIIQGLLDFARQDADAAEHVDLRVLVRDMLHLIKSGERAAERKINLDGLLADSTDSPACEVPAEAAQAVQPAPPLVYGHARQLQQVLMNLTLNALDATLPGGEVTLAARQKDGGIEVRISDNGKGISAAHRPHLFEPFFTTKPVGKGTGLGLYLSHGIVMAHRGHISVQSEEHKGVTVAVWLPAHAPEAVSEKR